MTAIVVVHSEPRTGNTRRLAEAIAGQLKAPVVDADVAQPGTLAGYDLVGFGSGVYLGRLHPDLHKLAGKLPARPGRRAFIFSTAGSCCTGYHDSLRVVLEQRGVDVIAEHTCPGSDSYRFPGSTINPACPTEQDLEAARSFARDLSAKLARGS